MTKFAHIRDDGVVIGWYTDEVRYPKMPPPATLHPLTEAEWSARITGQHWFVEGGKLVRGTEPSVPKKR